MEKGSQCVGMNECSRDTVAMPPIVDASSAVHRSLPTPPPPSISWFDSAAVRADLRSEVWPMGGEEKGGRESEWSVQGNGDPHLFLALSVKKFDNWVRQKLMWYCVRDCVIFVLFGLDTWLVGHAVVPHQISRVISVGE
jgi:hypothetical protein